MEELEKYGIHFNSLDKNDNVVQIYGNVNGFAHKRTNGKCKGSYIVNVTFFDIENKHIMITVETNEKDETIRSIDKLKSRILEIYLKKEK